VPVPLAPKLRTLNVAGPDGAATAALSSSVTLVAATVASHNVRFTILPDKAFTNTRSVSLRAARRRSEM
jgi:hypothetical protein